MIPKFVITLKNSKNMINFKKLYQEHNIDYEIFNGVDSRENEHYKYRNNIHPFSLLLTPKKILGCSLSHILLAKHIIKKNYKYTLVLEDDAYPFDYKNLESNIENIIEKMNKIDNKWDIINLHTDGIIQNNTIYTNCFSGSSAAYLISIFGAKKLANTYAYHNIDVYSSVSKKMKKYKSSNNLFWTDENNSIIRNNTNNYNNIVKNIYAILLSQLFSFRGEKNWGHLLSYDILQLPLLDVTLDATTLINASNVVIFYIFYKYVIKNKLTN